MIIRYNKIPEALKLETKDWKYKKLCKLDIADWKSPKEKDIEQNGLTVFGNEKEKCAFAVYRDKKFRDKLQPIAERMSIRGFVKNWNANIRNMVRSNVIGKNDFEDYPHSLKAKSGLKRVDTMIFARPSRGIASITLGIRSKGHLDYPPGKFRVSKGIEDDFLSCLNPMFRELEKFYSSAPEFLKTEIEKQEIPKEISYFGGFTTITVNFNLQCALHVDAMNLPDAYSFMPVFFFDNTEGGEICLPEHKFYFKTKSCDIAIFKGEKKIHGNLPVKHNQIRGKALEQTKRILRMSIVFYAAAGAKKIYYDRIKSNEKKPLKRPGSLA